jgi:hypothetical protein
LRSCSSPQGAPHSTACAPLALPWIKFKTGWNQPKNCKWAWQRNSDMRDFIKAYRSSSQPQSIANSLSNHLPAFSPKFLAYSRCNSAIPCQITTLEVFFDALQECKWNLPTKLFISNNQICCTPFATKKLSWHTPVPVQWRSLTEHIYEIAEKSQQQQFEGNMTMSAVITLWELLMCHNLRKCQTISFVRNGNDKLPWLYADFISSYQWA